MEQNKMILEEPGIAQWQWLTHFRCKTMFYTWNPCGPQFSWVIFPIFLLAGHVRCQAVGISCCCCKCWPSLRVRPRFVALILLKKSGGDGLVPKIYTGQKSGQALMISVFFMHLRAAISKGDLRFIQDVNMVSAAYYSSAYICCKRTMC